MNADEMRATVAWLLEQFSISAASAEVQALGNAGGLSGATIWQIQTPSQRLCLRRWPQEHPTRDHLAWVHGHLRRAQQRGCEFLPVPIADRHGETFVEHQGRLWELTPWMPGKADYWQHPSDARLIAALTSLARFHDGTSGSSDDRVGISSGIEMRWRQIHSATPVHLGRLARAIDGRHGATVERLAREMLQSVPAWLARATELLEPARRLSTALQPCLRDIWHDHVLFEGERVSGLIDFGAMRVDSPAGDLARLLGSLAASDAAQWANGLRAYELVRSLTDAQRQLLAAFDAANPPLSGLNWVRWLFREGRQFERLDGVEARMADVAARLRSTTRAASVILPHEHRQDNHS